MRQNATLMSELYGERSALPLATGLQLSWPRDTDSRRFVRKSSHYILPTDAFRLDFINTFLDDVSESEVPSVCCE